MVRFSQLKEDITKGRTGFDKMGFDQGDSHQGDSRQTSSAKISLSQTSLSQTSLAQTSLSQSGSDKARFHPSGADAGLAGDAGNEDARISVRFRDLEARADDGRRRRRPPAASGLKAVAAEAAEGPAASAAGERLAIYDAAFSYLRGVYEKVRRQESFDLAGAFHIVRRIAGDASREDPLLVRAIHHDSLKDYPIYHGVNTAIFSVKLALSLGWKPDRTESMGAAALLHDVGMAELPEALIYKAEPLSRSEAQMARARPERSHRILSAMGEEGLPLAECALRVHERVDGGGYPGGLAGDDVPPCARIIGLADMYEALIHTRPQGERHDYAQAIREILKTAKGGFQKEHIRALVSLISMFPLESWVRLNSNAIGRVIETRPENPMRPRLRLEYDVNSRPVAEPREVDLADQSTLFITGSVSERELRSLDAA